MEKEVPAHDEHKASTDFTGEDAGAPDRAPTRAQKTKRHCMRFWWIYLIAILLALMIIILCVIYVAIPKIVQHNVNKTSLELVDMQYLEPTSNSIVLTQHAVLHNPNSKSPTLDAFDAGYYLVTNGSEDSQPLMQIPVPKVHASRPTADVDIENANITFQSLDEVTKYTITVLGAESVTMALRGKTHLHLGGLPTYDVKYNEEFTFKGCNGLKGFNVTDLRINPLATSGPNMAGTAYIPNVSILTLALGNVTLSLTTGTTKVGTATINDLTLRPGNNTFPMTGTLDQRLVLSNLDDGVLSVNITGESVVYNDQHLTYYEQALSMAHLPFSVNVTQLLGQLSASSGET